jgi:hypothetical protein
MKLNALHSTLGFRALTLPDYLIFASLVKCRVLFQILTGAFLYAVYRFKMSSATTY